MKSNALCIIFYYRVEALHNTNIILNFQTKEAEVVGVL